VFVWQSAKERGRREKVAFTRDQAELEENNELHTKTSS